MIMEALTLSVLCLSEEGALERERDDEEVEEKKE